MEGINNSVFNMNVGKTNDETDTITRQRIVLPDGSTFEGETQNDQPHGHGTITYLANDACQSYEGIVLFWAPQGKGKLTWKNGTEYEGGFSNGAMTGKGVITWKNGGRYEGTFDMGFCEGTATYTYPQDDARLSYKGTFVAAKVSIEAPPLPHGRGIMMWKDGSCSEGEFNYGNPEGKRIKPSPTEGTTNSKNPSVK